MKTQTVNRKELLEVLENVSAGLASKELIEQSNSFIFSKNKVSTFNDEIAASAKTELKFEGAVDAQLLLKFLQKVKDKEIEIWSEDDELRIKGKKFDTGIKYDSDIVLPIDDVTIESDFEELPANFQSLAKLACLTTSKNLTKEILTCVHICDDKIESCDNDRFTICYPEDMELDCDILVPAKNLLNIIRRDDLIEIAVDDVWVHFKTDKGIVLSCRLVDEEYVDLSDHIPEDEGKQITIPEELKEILGRAELFSRTTLEQEKFITVEISKKEVQVSAQNESSWIIEKEKINYKGKSIKFTINAPFLKDVLSITNKINIIDGALLFKDESSIHFVQLEE